jgi:DHA1 family tetracycline resistance protein-like MFS transporter
MVAPAPRKPAVGFIFITLVLIVLGFGLIIPVLPELVKKFEGGEAAQGAASYGFLIGVFTLLQFMAAPLLGALSDRFGRRKVILIALAGTSIDYVIMGLAPNLRWLFFARMISGVTAGAFATCNAYIADVTPPEKRAQGFGMVGAAFGLGFAIGPAIGGFLGSLKGADGQPMLQLPFFVAAGCVALNWLYGAFVLPESLPPERRKAFSWKRANPLGALLNLRRIHGVALFATMHFVYMLGHTMLQTMWVLYTSYRFGWTPGQTGASLMVAGVTSMIVQGKLVGPILKRTGEARGLLMGLLTTIVVFTLYGLATQGWMMYVIIVFGAFGGLAGPAAQALITRRVPPNEQGAVQGALGSLQSLAGVISPPIAAWSFAAGIKPDSQWHLPGISFFEAAFLAFCAFLIASRAVRVPHLAEPAPQPAA